MQIDYVVRKNPDTSSFQNHISMWRDDKTSTLEYLREACRAYVDNLKPIMPIFQFNMFYAVDRQVIADYNMRLDAIIEQGLATNMMDSRASDQLFASLKHGQNRLRFAVRNVKEEREWIPIPFINVSDEIGPSSPTANHTPVWFNDVPITLNELNENIPEVTNNKPVCQALDKIVERFSSMTIPPLSPIHVRFEVIPAPTKDSPIWDSFSLYQCAYKGFKRAAIDYSNLYQDIGKTDSGTLSALKLRAEMRSKFSKARKDFAIISKLYAE